MVLGSLLNSIAILLNESPLFKCCSIIIRADKSRCFWLPFGLPVFILSSFCTGRGSSAVVFYKKKKEKSMQK
jgi:hypothetical protein